MGVAQRREALYYIYKGGRMISHEDYKKGDIEISEHLGDSKFKVVSAESNLLEATRNAQIESN